MRAIEDGVFVGGQIAPADVAALAAAGVRTIVNNRPDGEEPGQPDGAAIEAAARAAGVAYVAAPIAGGIAPEAVDAMRAALGAMGRCWPIANRACDRRRCGRWCARARGRTWTR